MQTRHVALSVSILASLAHGCGGGAPTPVTVTHAADEGITILGALPASGACALLSGDAIAVGEGNVGGCRMTIGPDGTIELAPDVFASGVAAALRIGDAFLFVDVDGEVWRASTFLGPVENVGNVGLPSFRASHSSPGRLAIVSGMDLYTSVGTLPLERAALPPGVVVDAAFRDADHGAAILEGGVVVTTNDAGHTWQRLDVGGPAAMVGGNGGLAVLRAGAAFDAAFFAIDDTGLAGRVAPIQAFTVSLPPADPYLLAVARAFPAFGLDEGYVLMRLADRSLLLRGPGDQRRIDTQSGAIDALPEMPAGNCLVYRWGPYVAGACDHSQETATAHRSRDGRTFEEVFPLTVASSPRFSTDGHSAVWTGGCPGGDPNGLCLAREENGFALEALELSAETISAPAGDWMLLEDSEEGPLRLLRLSTGVVTEPNVPAERIARVATLATDGSVLAIVATTGGEAGERVLLVGPPGGPLIERVLPVGIRAVAFLDAERGFATGDDAATLARTFDGGATWEPLPSPVEGDAFRAHLPVDALVGAQIHCSAMGCWAGDSIVVSMLGWGRTLDVRPAHIGDSETASDDAVSSTFGGALLTCDATPGPMPAAPAWPGRAPRGATIIERTSGRTSARIVIASSGAIRVEWRGEDASGRYALATRDAPQEPGEPVDPRLFAILGASRASVDLAICPDGVCHVLHGAPGRALVPFLGPSPTSWETPLVRAPLSGGGEAILFADPGHERARIVGSSADGTLSELFGAALAGYERHVGLAQSTRGDTALVAERVHGPGFVLVPISGAALPEALPIEGDLAICASDAPAADTWTATFVGGPPADGYGGLLDRLESIVIELSGGTACVRSAVLAASGEPAARAAWLTATGGQLVGTGGTPEEWNEVRCSLGPAPSEEDEEQGYEADEEETYPEDAEEEAY